MFISDLLEMQRLAKNYCEIQIWYMLQKKQTNVQKKKKITSQAKEITGEEEVGNKVQKGSIPLTLDTKLEINMILFFSEHL